MVCVRRVLKNSCARRPGESGCLAFLERRDHFVLPRGVELRERRLISLAAIRIELSQPAPVEILKIGVSAGERQIDVIEHARIERARLARLRRA